MIKTRSSERGQALIIIAAAIVGLIALTAISVDGGLAYLDRRSAQNAADTAALGAALTKIRNGNWLDAGLARAASNGYDNNGTTNTVEVYNPPISGPYTGNAEYIQVLITSHIKTYFAPVVGITQLTNKVQAVARARPPIPTPMGGGSAVFTLNTECTSGSSFIYQASAEVYLYGSGVYVNSPCSDAFKNQSGPGMYIDTCPGVQVVGDIQGGEAVHTTPDNASCKMTDVQPYPEPILPNLDPVCADMSTANITGGDTLNPGNWTGAFPPTGVTKLAPGLYCVHNGNFSLHAGDSLTGKGVLLYIIDGSVTLNGQTTIDLEAPTTDPYKGLLMYLPPSNDKTVSISGGGSVTMVGSILAPSSLISVTGSGSTDAPLNTQLVGKDVKFVGGSKITIRYIPDQQYQPPIPPSLQLAN
jgi:Flp pilus assembly protein TadG